MTGRGATLVELMIVIIVIGVLSLVGFTVFAFSQQRAAMLRQDKIGRDLAVAKSETAIRLGLPETLPEITETTIDNITYRVEMDAKQVGTDPRYFYSVEIDVIYPLGSYQMKSIVGSDR